MQPAQLDVKNFSCIDSACLQVADMTVIIGPQASGKSVICKLYYFFSTVLYDLPRKIHESETPAEISETVLAEFDEWFPPTSWGARAFSIRFSIGEYWMQVHRGRSKSAATRAKLGFSPNFAELILQAAEISAKAKKKSPENKRIFYTFEDFDALSKIVHAPFRRLAEETHLYIPAGRSFFTSIGKIVTAFEDRSMLDPVVTRFGRLITQLREHPGFDREPKPSILKELDRLIDGEVVNERGKQYLATPDGRSIPFSALSSGQQELLPLLTALRYALRYRRHSSHMLYIEEPEAHLFPTAQATLVEIFAKMINVRSSLKGKEAFPIRTLLTTHSPYVLAKLNNLIKAGSLSGKLSPERRRDLDQILPISTWLAPQRVKAYAICDRKLVDIIDEYGLINGDYIDDVSAETGMQFDSMLEMEMHK